MAYYRKENKTWTANWFLKGKQHTKGGFSSRKIAEIYEAQKKIEIERKSVKLPTIDHTKISELISGFLSYQKIRKKEKSYKRDKEVLSQFLKYCEENGNVYVRHIDMETIETFSSWKQEQITPQGKKTSKRTVNLYIKTIRLCFDYAKKREIVEENFVKKVDLLRVDKEEYPRILTKKEIEIIENIATKSVIKNEVFVLLRTGLRSQELCDLEVNDIDFANKKIIVQAAKAKARKTRHIPMTSSTYKMLEEITKKTIKEKRTHLFCTSKGKKRNNVDLNKLFRKVLLKAKDQGVDISRVNVHTLRRTFISHMVMNGVDAIKIMSIVGHEDYSTMKKYLALTSNYLSDIPEIF